MTPTAFCLLMMRPPSPMKGATHERRREDVLLLRGVLGYPAAISLHRGNCHRLTWKEDMDFMAIYIRELCTLSSHDLKKEKKEIEPMGASAPSLRLYL